MRTELEALLKTLLPFQEPSIHGCGFQQCRKVSLGPSHHDVRLLW